MQVRLTNPADNSHYDFLVNPENEQEMTKARGVTRTANTGLTGAVHQQGDDGDLLITLEGTILHRSQYQAMWSWYELCRTQTIYYRDFDGASSEVQIVSFAPLRKRKLRTISRDASMPFHYYTYTLGLLVYRFIDGDLHTAGVTP